LNHSENHLEKFEAEDVASGVYGVKEIHNHISVLKDAAPYAYQYEYNYYYPYGDKDDYSYDPSKTDFEIEEDIADQIWWSPYVNLSEVDIEVENGVATLSGDVDSWSEYYYAERNAFDGGALAVENNLNVTYTPVNN
jgi:osmotically-inducible protein OsmY